jgi:hypothetical protein
VDYNLWQGSLLFRSNIGCQIQDKNEERYMSAPSRRPEIRRRRTRKEKIVKLRKSHAAASTEAERTRIAGKLQRMAVNSPGQPLLKKD